MKLDHNDTGTSNTGSLEINYDVRINIKPTNLNYCLYRAPDAEQVSLYTHSGADTGGFLCQRTVSGLHIKLNSYHSGGHRNLCLNSSNLGKLIVGSEVEYTDTEKFIINSTSRFKDAVVADDSIKLSGPNNSGALYCKGDPNQLNTNADLVSLNYNISLNKTTNVESAILPAEKTAKIQLNQFAIQFQMSSVAGILPSTLFEINPLSITTFKNIVPSGSLDIGTTGNPFNNLYTTTITASNIGASSSFTTSDTSTVTFNNSITTRSIIPQLGVTYDIGSNTKEFNNIYCGSLFCIDGQVGGQAITSDIRVKTDIVDLDSNFGLDFVNRMRPVSYTYKNKTRTHFGLIADELYDLLQTDNYSFGLN
jgi:hypothetical protein